VELKMADTLSVVRDIAASPALVYAAISNVTRMGEWSEECYRCEWQEGSREATVGATFQGYNRNGELEWTTQGRVIEATPGHAFVFECSMYEVHYSTWGYHIESIEGGSRVTEWSDDLRPASAVEFSKRVSGIDDRRSRNHHTMSVTLDRLAAALEAS
jgi:uncharacterized protein YndB with AHSA1/START domain